MLHLEQGRFLSMESQGTMTHSCRAASKRVLNSFLHPIALHWVAFFSRFSHNVFFQVRCQQQREHNDNGN